MEPNVRTASKLGLSYLRMALGVVLPVTVLLTVTNSGIGFGSCGAFDLRPRMPLTTPLMAVTSTLPFSMSRWR